MKIYDVHWEDADGLQEFFIRMTVAQARAMKIFLERAAIKGIIHQDPMVEAITGESPSQLYRYFHELYSNVVGYEEL